MHTVLICYAYGYTTSVLLPNMAKEQFFAACADPRVTVAAHYDHEGSQVNAFANVDQFQHLRVT